MVFNIAFSVLFLLITGSSYAMEAGQSDPLESSLDFHCSRMKNFVEIGESEIFCTVHRYRDENGNVITLVPMSHDAESSYYVEVKEVINNKIVIYEMNGLTLESRLGNIEEIKSLGENFYDAYEALASFAWLKKTLGYEEQDNVFLLDSAKRLIHADFVDEDQRFMPTWFVFKKYRELLLRKQEDMESELREWHSRMHDVKHSSISKATQSPRCINCTLQHEIFTPIEELLSACIESIERQIDAVGIPANITHDDVVELKCLIQKYDPDVVLDKDTMFEVLKRTAHRPKDAGMHQEDVDMHSAREQIVFGKILQTLKAKEIDEELCVVYGANHMPEIEHFILNNGFKEIEHSQKKILTLKR